MASISTDAAKNTTNLTVIAHAVNDTQTNANHTIKGLQTAHSAHVGQLFFDQDLISTIEKNAPYTANTQPLTQNTDDWILLQEQGKIDPFVEYVFLGDDPTDGIFGWISMGMDGREDKNVMPAAYYTENGGVENPNFPSFPPGPPPS